MRRYAIYFAPKAYEPLAGFARTWLGRDPESGAACAHPTIPGISADRLMDITAEPRRYGFHATLKPPFALMEGASEIALLDAAADFARSRTAFSVPGLELEVIGKFLALTPRGPALPLNDLAADCVRAFEPFRAALCDAELARRRAPRLTPRQDELLARWGYPYVLEEFRFHLTLTGNLDEPERSTIYAILHRLTEPFREVPLEVGDITVFMQHDRDRPFCLAARLPFAAQLRP